MRNLSGLTESIYADEAILSQFSGVATVSQMLVVEAALARAQARCGVIPSSAAGIIHEVCHGSEINAMLDMDAIATDAVAAGNIAIPFVKQLTAAVARVSTEAARYVHWGATSQDILDTALVLQMLQVASRLDAGLASATQACARLTGAHRDTIMVGRTWLQHALPTTFGAKTAGWLEALARSRLRLRRDASQMAMVQFGGAVGTLASLGPAGSDVARALAAELGLGMPAMPWHTHRDCLVSFAGSLGVLAGTMGKVARDLSLMAQSEIGEVSEPAGPGRGGSSTMPHKRNPVGCAAVLAAAIRVPPLVSTMLSGMIQEHERALGGWQAEWDVLPQIAALTGGALRHLAGVLDGLDVYPERMAQNLEITGGLILGEAYMLALGARLGRLPAHALVERASRDAVASQRPLKDALRDALESDAATRGLLSDDDLNRLGDPANYVGEAPAICDRVLAAWSASPNGTQAV